MSSKLTVQRKFMQKTINSGRNEHIMDNKPLDDSKREKRIRKMSMCVSLFVCIAALALGFWSAINRTAKLTGNATTAHHTYVSSVKQVEQNQTKVKAPTKTTAADEVITEKTTEEIDTTANFFSIPVGGKITKQYDEKQLQYSNTYKDWRLHLGIDITAKENADVHSAGNGKVKSVSNDPLLGQVVEIDHGNGIVAYYCGLKTPTVKAGDLVEIGNTIGSIGSAPFESVDADHLHFEVKVNGKYADPFKAMNLKSE